MIDAARASLALILSMATLLASCTRSPTTGFLKGDTMGTFYTVHYSSDRTIDRSKIEAVVESTLEGYENELSNWRPDSWISQFNAAPANQPIHVPGHAFKVIQLSLELAELTDGAFDPTLSPVIQLWGFGTQRSERVPDDASIREALSKVGFEKLVLDADKKTLLKQDRHLQLNCSAVAKGYAVDLVAFELREMGVSNLLVNIGGEIYADGVDIDGSPWEVGIYEDLDNGSRIRSSKSIPLRDQALATSGHSQRAMFVDGQRYSHIIDSKTGRPVAASFASATVMAPNCALADGLATIALIIDIGEMKQLAGQYEGIEYFYTPWGSNPRGREDRLDPPRNFSHSEDRGRSSLPNSYSNHSS